MSIEKVIIVVPTDFTKVADTAVEHAIGLCKSIANSEVVLLHIIGKEKEKASAEVKLKEQSENLTQKTSIKVSYEARLGNIFDDIGAAATDLKAKLIIMGTHGVKGMQHITGSYAVKVITHSTVPFIVVQERGFRDGYNNLVLPFDLSKDSKQKLSLAINIAKVFNSKVHIIYPQESDTFLVNAINNNVSLAKSELRNNKIEFDVKMADEKGNFVKQFLTYAAAKDADLIAIVNSQEMGFPEILAGTDERQIITNDAQIPTMILNPIKSSIGGSVLFN
jgi:nucleotide-binding universal stress UspA family protein